MARQLFIKTIFFSLITIFSCKENEKTNDETIIKIEMNLNAFGVESDDFPSIQTEIDFSKRSSNCIKTYYNPTFKDSIYSLSKSDLKKILGLINISDLKKLRKKYSVSKTDQPSSTTIIYTNKAKYTINDYGLKGDYPLQDLYEIVYNLKK